MNWELLLNYINGECNAREAQTVEDWADEQAEHRYLLNYLQRRGAQMRQPLKQSDIDEQWLRLLDRIFENPQSGAKPGFFRSYWITGIAASLLMFSVLGWYYYKKAATNAEQPQTVQTAKNTRGHITLPDGSQVFMAPDSKITFSTFSNGKREVHLKGEAFFNVKHAEHYPFIIYTEKNLSVTVLGTSFNVYARPQANIEVKVASGLVGVVANNHTSYLKAGQQLICDAFGRTPQISNVKTREASSLQNETLVFDQSNADDIAIKLHRWYNIDVKVHPSARKRARFSGEMKDTGLNDVLQALGYATGLHYQYTKDNSILLF